MYCNARVGCFENACFLDTKRLYFMSKALIALHKLFESPKITFSSSGSQRHWIDLDLGPHADAAAAAATSSSAAAADAAPYNPLARRRERTKERTMEEAAVLILPSEPLVKSTSPQTGGQMAILDLYSSTVCGEKIECAYIFWRILLLYLVGRSVPVAGLAGVVAKLVRPRLRNLKKKQPIGLPYKSS